MKENKTDTVTQNDKHQTVVVLDFGDRHSQTIARKVRDNRVFAVVLPYSAAVDRVRQLNPIGIILACSAHANLTADPAIFDLGVPVLTICGDIKTCAHTNKDKKQFAIQFDESKCGTEQGGKQLAEFLKLHCGAKGDWTMAAVASKTIADLKKDLDGKKGLCGLSGGVDSAVAAALVAKACHGLTCIFVDHGLLRKGEVEEVVSAFGSNPDINFVHVDASELFLSKLEGVTDPEQKRKIIGEQFIRVFEKEAKKIGAVDFLVQGTIYPDIIESGVGGAMVKSHHNVGGLPSVVEFKQLVEPLKELFKDEVRELGLEIGLTKQVVMRQPFPGPGLGVRVIGDLTKDRLDTLRDADFILRSEIANANLDTKIWQYFAVLLTTRSVGVKNGARVYGYTVALRAVHSVDGMSADWARIPFEVLEKISCRIVAECRDINRVVYDITSKPPSTIEWE